MGWADAVVGLVGGAALAKKGVDDLQYTRQLRNQTLAQGYNQNQNLQLQNQQMQRTMADQDAVQKAAREALTPQDGQNTSAPSMNGLAALAGNTQSQQPSQQPGQQGQPQTRPISTGITPGASLHGLKSSGMQPEDLAKLDQENGLPVGTMYGLMSAESSGNPNAVSPKGAQGLFQVMPATAANPGYGLKAFDPKDPQGAAKYFAAMYKKAGGDMNKALGYWNAGPNGNPNNPETQAFAPRVMKGSQEFQQQYGVKQQAEQPSPADHYNASQNAGVDAKLPQINQASQAQQAMIQQNMATAQNLMRQGRADLAQPFLAQAQKLQEQGVALESKKLTMQKTANDTVVKAAAGVNDQSSYNGLLSEIRDNPAMQSAVKGLNLTGDYTQDQNKIATLANRSMTMQQQQELAIKKQELDLKRQHEEREQQKQDAPLRAQAAAQAADQGRMEKATTEGIPFVPSPVARGGDPILARQEQVKIDAANLKQVPLDNAARVAARGTLHIADQMGDLLNKGIKTGDMLTSTASGASQQGAGFISKMAYTQLNPDQQTFDKLSNLMVAQMQASLKGNGGGVSSQTAAMYRNIMTQKPELGKNPETNRRILDEIKVSTADTANMLSFKDEFAKANPQADRNQATQMWENYRQAVPLMMYDPAQAKQVPNPEAMPTHKGYVDYHDWFRKNYSGG